MRNPFIESAERLGLETPVCGRCADGLCEDHPRDCAFGGVLPCACPNAQDA